MKREKSPLDRVEVASPCSAAWEEMIGDERVRFCDLCALNVYNLSAMGRKEAEELVRAHEGRLCIRYYKRRDGTLLTDNCPVGLRRARARLKILAGAAASVLAAIFGLPWLGEQLTVRSGAMGECRRQCAVNSAIQGQRCTR